MSTPQQFVCIFPFNFKMENVHLVRKSKGPTPENPNGQVGKWNGQGGKIETTDSSPAAAALREFEEETGIILGADQLHHFRTEQYAEQAIVHYYYVKEEYVSKKLLESTKTLDGDSLIYISINEINHSHNLFPDHEFVWNVPYLLAMAKAMDSLPRNLWPIL